MSAASVLRELINDYREASGLARLPQSGVLNVFAIRRATQESVEPDGKLDHNEARDVQVAGGYPEGAGEVLAGNYQTEHEVLAGWQASPGHNAALLAPWGKEIGVGYADIEGAPIRPAWCALIGIRGPFPHQAVLPMVRAEAIE